MMKKHNLGIVLLLLMSLSTSSFAWRGQSSFLGTGVALVGFGILIIADGTFSGVSYVGRKINNVIHYFAGSSNDAPEITPEQAAKLELKRITGLALQSMKVQLENLQRRDISLKKNDSFGPILTFVVDMQQALLRDDFEAESIICEYRARFMSDVPELMIDQMQKWMEDYLTVTQVPMTFITAAQKRLSLDQSSATQLFSALALALHYAGITLKAHPQAPS